MLDGELALYEHAVMTEALFTMLLLCALAAILLLLPVLHLAEGGALWAAGQRSDIGPAHLGCCCLGLVLLLPGLRPASWCSRSRLLLHASVPAAVWHFGKRLRLTGIAAIAGTAVLIVLPVMLWNARTLWPVRADRIFPTEYAESHRSSTTRRLLQ